MGRLLLLLSFALIVNGTLVAQSGDDHKKIEFFAGYSNAQEDGDGKPLNGFNVSGVYNFTRYIGVKGDFSATFNKGSFQGTFTQADGNAFTFGYRGRNSFYNALAGIQLKDNSTGGRFKPFAHALVGVGHRRTKVTDFTCEPADVCILVVPVVSGSSSGIAGALGGGLDIKINSRIQFRVIQADYNPVQALGRTEHNARFGTGIVF